MTHLSPVDVDLLGDITRLPERQRLTIIINELGAGFAGRGNDLNEVIRRANPALQRPTRCSDPRRREQGARQPRRRLRSGAEADRRTTASSSPTSSRRATRSRGDRRTPRRAGENLADFPAFLRQLGPAVTRLGKFAEQTTPTFTDLGDRRPRHQPRPSPASGRSRTARRRSSRARQDRQDDRAALVASQPLLGQLETLGQLGQAVRRQLRANCSPAFARPGGWSGCSTSSSWAPTPRNGYDSLGHFLRADVVGRTAPAIRCRRPRAAAPTSSTCRARRRRRSAARARRTPRACDGATLAVLKERPRRRRSPSIPARCAAERGARARPSGADRPAGRRIERRHDLLHPAWRKLRSRAGSAQLPARATDDDARPPPIRLLLARPGALALRAAAGGASADLSTVDDDAAGNQRHDAYHDLDRPAEPTGTDATPPAPADALPRRPPRRRRRPKRRARPARRHSTSSTPTTTPDVQAQSPQAATAASPTRRHVPASAAQVRADNGAAGTATERRVERCRRQANHRAPPPSALTPPLPFALGTPVAGVPDFFIESLRIPPFLLPIYQAAGTAYGIPWQVLAAINEVETDYGRDLNVSSAGAEGWMQFLPSTWAQYGVDANGDGFQDPYNPADAIFAAARYLKAAGGNKSIRTRCWPTTTRRLTSTRCCCARSCSAARPPDLLSAITGLTEARFPVHAPSHFATVSPSPGRAPARRHSSAPPSTPRTALR